MCAGLLGGRDVVGGVADHERFARLDADPLERQPDDLRPVRGLAAVAARRIVEEAPEPHAPQALLRDALGEAAHEPEADFVACEPVEHRLRPGARLPVGGVAEPREDELLGALAPARYGLAADE